MKPAAAEGTPPYRVLYLNHGAKPSGAEFALWRMLGAQDPARVQASVVFGEEGPAADLMRELGLETHVVPLAKSVGEVRKDTLGAGAFMHLGRLAVFAAYALRIAVWARRHRIQIIHTNTIKAHLYGALAGRLAGVPVVWHVRDYVNAAYLPGAAVKVVRFLARQAPRHIIGVSRSVLDQLQLGPLHGKSTVILDGLSEQELAGNSPPLFSPPAARPLRIGLVGRLAHWKGQHIFLQAAAQVTAAGCEAQYVIIGAPLFGEDDYAAGLHEQAEKLGLGARVQFLGFTRDVSGELRQLDILVHASVTGEPFGQVVIEGLAAGLPVIASRGGGVPEILTDGVNGLLTPMGDASALAAALLSLIRNPAERQRLGNNGYAHVRKCFRAKEGAKMVANIYRQILE